MHAFEVVIGVRHHHRNDVGFATMTSPLLENGNQAWERASVLVYLIKHEQGRSPSSIRLLLPNRSNDSRTDAICQRLFDVWLKSIERIQFVNIVRRSKLKSGWVGASSHGLPQDQSGSAHDAYRDHCAAQCSSVLRPRLWRAGPAPVDRSLRPGSSHP